MYEATGKIKVIFDTQTFPSGFTKREFVVTVGDDNYPQDLKFEMIKDKCTWLDQFQPDQAVTVSFDIRGNEFKDKYYVNLNCWKILADDASGGGGSQAPSQPATSSSTSSEVEPSPDDLINDDIPF
jgi:single-strand DNA-binding protein